MDEAPPIIAKDREFLAAWVRGPATENLGPIVERYLPLVYSSAYRRTSDATRASEVTRAAFLVLARRARKLRKKTVLAGWLFEVTAVACRKLKLPQKSRWRWLRWRRRSETPSDATLWTRIAPEVDRALDRLPSAQRHAVLLLTLLQLDCNSAAQILHTKERRAGKRNARALKILAKRLRRKDSPIAVDALAHACATEGCAAPIPEELALGILASIGESLGKKPTFKLARRTLNSMAWSRWRRRFAIGIPSFILLLATAAGAAWYVDSLSGHSRLISAFLVWSVKNEAKTTPGLAEPARTWPSHGSNASLRAARVRRASDLYQTTNIWMAHLNFSREQWKALEPKRIGALPHFLQPDGTALLRNPEAQRSGLAGVLGFDFDWSQASFEFGGASFTNVAVRFKGNGTYLSSLYGWKRSFKVDLNKTSKGQKLGELDEFNFHNLIADQSCMSDALAYEFFRDVGVPAPRTAYAWLTVSVTEQWDRRPLGLYALVEPVNEDFAADRFGSKKTPIFKPVTYQLFEHLGDDWPAYAEIYDLKTKATTDQQRRVIEFGRLVSFASDAEFAERLGGFLDLDEFARFLAGEVLLSSYDSFLANGQNFYVYLDPRSNKFGFIPWDLDLAWGSFFLLGTTKERERASIWHPWVGRHRFLERVMAVEEFREIYRQHLEDFSTRLLVPDRLFQRIDQIAAVIREPVAAESAFRLEKFDQALSREKVERPPGGNPHGVNRPVHQIKRFIENRARSVRQQLDGKSQGIILERNDRN